MMQGLSRILERNKSNILSVCEMQYTKAHPDLLSIVQHFMFEHCELFILYTYNAPDLNMSFHEIEKIVRVCIAC